MNRNIIDAIGTLLKRHPFYLNDPYSNENSLRSARYWSIEEYVKNLFADTFHFTNRTEKISRWGDVFHIGNAINPPDLMLRGGDAIEIKNVYIPERINEDTYAIDIYGYKTKYLYSPLVLNTVYPRQKLFVDDPLVTNSCCKAEKWTEKDIIYAVGVSKGKQLTHFCMVYGCDYCASSEHYKKILQEMRARLQDIPNFDFNLSYERELGRISAIDPTGTTRLNLRNMWHIENPWSFFRYVYRPNRNAKFNFMCIIRNEKFFRFRNSSKLLAWREICSDLIIEQVRIKDPDNPNRMNDALLIRYEI